MSSGRILTAPTGKQSRNGLLWLLFAGLALRVIMPVGYMPAPIGDGVPFVLCPGAFVDAGFLRVDDGAAHGQHDHHADAADTEPWESCPFGFAAGSAVLTADAGPTLSLPRQSTPAHESRRPTGSALLGFYRARAPPGIQPRHV